jgi:peptidoglycan/LPS O-acetylase OafA/YrhL
MSLPAADAPRVYFPGLNGIRAIAACGVMLSHALLGLNRFHGHEKLAGMDLANHGVIMFFTLSGFLITFLLLQEQERFGTIDFKAFYFRRILRIWPLYFFYIALAMTYHWQFEPAGVSNAPYVLLFVFFLPNIAFNLGRCMPDTAPLWSIGIEEQFYAVWPFVVSRVRSLRFFLCLLIVGLIGLRISVHVAAGSGKHLASSIVDSLGYDAMAVGALFAVLYREGNARLLRAAQTWIPHIAFAGLVVLLTLNKLRFLSLFGPPITSCVTGLFIVSQIAGRKKLLDLERPVLSYVGRISFGIYVYHMLVITVIARLLPMLAPEAIVPTPVLLLLVGAVTLGVAALSYRYLEAPFLRFKDSVSRIRTSTFDPTAK